MWLEGVSLSSQNWHAGDRFDIEWGKKAIIITRNANGSRKIAGTSERPIIDTNTDKITDCLNAETGNYTDFVITENTITITKANAFKNMLKQASSTIAATTLATASVVAPLLPNICIASDTKRAHTKRVLVACEFSGRVRDAFANKGHDAISCDLLPSEGCATNPHAMGDVSILLRQRWDMILAFPPCTYLTSAALWRNLPKHDPSGERAKATEEALQFVERIMNANAPHILVENPVGCIGTRIRPADQTIQPWQYGHPESKTTCLWLTNLPKLQPTNILSVQDHGHQNEKGKWYWQNQTPTGQNKLGPSKDRWKKRSLTYQGIANAMAEQYSEI